MNKFGNWCKSLFVSHDGHEAKLLAAAKGEGAKAAYSSIAAAVLGILGGLLIMLIVNPMDAFPGLIKLLQGGLEYGPRGVGNILYYATGVLLTGLSVGLAFKTGLFNIGATGQYTMGLFFSLYTGHFISSSWIICLLAGMLGGMLWGFIPGLFKALFNVSEVITSIMTNYIGMYLVELIIISSGKLYNGDKRQTFPMPATTDLPKWGLDELFPGSYVSCGIIIAILVAIAVYFLMNHTTLGFELKACGMNKDAAKYAGINQNSRIILSMVIAGGLAGLGGAMFIQGGTGNMYKVEELLLPEGFNGIAVALLGVSNPIGIIFAALFFAHIQYGGNLLQALDFNASIIDVIVGIIIYFSAFAMLFKGVIAKWFKRAAERKSASVVEEDVATEGDITEDSVVGESNTEEDVAALDIDKEDK